MADTFAILDDALDPRVVLEAVRDPACGAVAGFLGTVRATADGRRVIYLDYEVHERMALRQFTRLAAALRDAHRVHHVAIHHRRGRVEVGEASVAIAVSAPRRPAALGACADAIERLKRDIPIWKKEVFPDGHRWVEGS